MSPRLGSRGYLPPGSRRWSSDFRADSRRPFRAFSLLEAAFIAGGIDRESELHDYCRKFENFVDTLAARERSAACPASGPRRVRLLHQSMLRGGYNLQASDLREAIDRGRFNCVTASVLFNVLTAPRTGGRRAGDARPRHEPIAPAR